MTNSFFRFHSIYLKLPDFRLSERDAFKEWIIASDDCCVL